MGKGVGRKRSAGAREVLTADFLYLFSASALFFGSLYLIIPVLPLYMVETAGASVTQVGLMMGSLTVSSCLFRPYVGRKLDTLGRRSLILIGASVFVVASPLYIICRNVPSLTALIVFHGLGIACYHTASLTYIGDVAPGSATGKSMAWFQTSFNLGIMSAPFIGVFIKNRFGYPPVFVSAAAAAVAALVLTARVRESRTATPLKEAGPRRSAMPARLIILASVAVSTGTVTLGAAEAFLPLFAKDRAIPHFALFFTISAGWLIVLRLFGGSITDRVSKRPVVLFALLALGGSMFILAVSRSFQGLAVAATVYGAGFAFLSPGLSALLIDLVKPEDLGRAFGIYTAAFEGGIAFGAMALAPAASGLGFGTAFGFVGAISLAGALFYSLAYGPLTVTKPDAA